MRPRIKRAIASVTLVGAALMATSACGVPPGTDGDLTNQWPGMTAVTGWEPKPGTCHKDFSTLSHRSSYSPVDCATDHFYETVHIGAFTDDAATLTESPARGTPELKAAFDECDGKTTEFMGGEWRHGRISLGVSVPSPGNWAGGARWFRCEVSATWNAGSVMSRTKSLKGEFAAASELKLGCFEIPADGGARVPTDCTAAHNGEFAGVFTMTGTFDELEESRDRVHAKCRSVIAGYVGVPDNGEMRYRTGTSYSSATRTDWEFGDRAIRCYLYFGEKKVTQSLKGAGTKGLPINYR